jgi:hypothetical protein
VYAIPVDNEEAHGTVDACQTIPNYPGVFEPIGRERMRHVEACIFSTFHKCVLSAVNDRLNISEHILIRTGFFFFIYVELVPNIFLHISVIASITPPLRPL